MLRRPEGRKRSQGRFVASVKGLAALACLSASAGLLGAVPALMAASGAVQVAEPLAEHWKGLPDSFGTPEIASTNTLLDRDGNVFAQVWSENRTELTSLDQVSDFAKQALVDTEDRTFWQHKGIDLRGTLRAALTGSGGGSGITQQVVKNLQFYDQAGTSRQAAVESSVQRKIQELRYALRYEKEHSKDEILLEYFNTVAFGGPSTYSIETAARFFFGKQAKDLDLAESAVLVGSVQNPVRYDLEDPESESGYKARQQAVLGRMVAEGHITSQQAQDAYAQPLDLVLKRDSNGTCASSAYPFYCSYVMDYLADDGRLGETPEERSAVLRKGGLVIRTQLDPDAMQAVHDQLFRDYGADNRLAAPTAVVEPGTGAVLAMGTNREYGTGEGQTTINLPLHPTGSGSVYKLITLAAALQSGFTEKDLTFSSRCPLVDPDYDTPPGGVRNSESCAAQGGLMDYRKATATSSNTWFSELIIKVGVDKVKEVSSQMGLSAPEGITSRSISYTLGTTENSVVSVAAAFATFSNGGVYCPATPVQAYSYADGSVPPVPETYDPEADACRRVLSPHDAGTVLKAMRANVSGEIPQASGVKFATPGFDTVAKSGTNQLYNSTWVILAKGYSVFTNIYNPDQLTDGIDYVRYRGGSTRWWDHVAGYTARDVMTSLLSRTGNQPLPYDDPDDSYTPVPVDRRSQVTVPSVVGMSPQQALEAVGSLGLTVHVSRDTVPAPEGFPSGVVAQQSVPGGTRLPAGSKREILLHLSQ